MSLTPKIHIMCDPVVLHISVYMQFSNQHCALYVVLRWLIC